MLQALRLAKGIDFIRYRIVIIRAVEQECVQLRKSLPRGQAGSGIDFDPVASGEDDGLVHDARLAQQMQRRRNLRFHKSKPFPHRDWGGVVAEADDDEGHCFMASSRGYGFPRACKFPRKST